ncbi:hypothetical protein I0C86_40700 [Plantactinospora sp. S1510]|uniref:Uncharacterized protein n=1 Tax=Plantactinospora alkalitolerans TaxID=2789879 RepID=A0ABS0H9P5_9ACTN|nr:hypothetical protein [Plantactinospora alkalitolerans]MBF9135201.1 hypothetical protein [Plantactinospora alkalitolerans]
MSTQQQEQNKTAVWATIFGGILAAAAGPIGIVVAASAVAIQQALFPNVGENDERREERQHENDLDRAAKRQRRLARHQGRLDEMAAQQQAYRQRRRDYLTNGGEEPYRYALDKNGQPIMVDGKPKRAGFWSRLGRVARASAAHAVLGAARAHEGYVTEKEAATKRREAGEPVVKPAIAGLYGAAAGYLGLGRGNVTAADQSTADKVAPPAPAAPATPSDAAKPAPAPGSNLPLVDPEKTQEVPAVGSDDRLAGPVTPDAADVAQGPANRRPVAEDPDLKQTVDWLATGGSGFPAPTGEGARRRDEFLAYEAKQRELFAEGDGPSGRLNIPAPAEQAEGTENDDGGTQMASVAEDTVRQGKERAAGGGAAPQGEANVELIAGDLEDAAAACGEVRAAMLKVEELIAEANAAKATAKARVAAAKQRGEVKGAEASIAAAVDEYEAACNATGALLDQIADASSAATLNIAKALDVGGLAQKSLDPTLDRLDGLRSNGGSGDMAATATSD